MELIDRQTAIDAVTDELDMIDHVPQWVFDRLEGRLKQLPPVTPKQRTGKWIKITNTLYKCDQCGAVQLKGNYCKDCGAKMEGAGNETD